MGSTPTPGGTSAMNMPSFTSSASATLASYEPPQSYPLSLKPVVTPANNPDFYKNERKRKAEAHLGPLARKYRNIMLPGTGFIGPNIYVRAQMALQSGVEEEECYALHHLVKISHERGDKYRFDQFPGLAEALVKKALQISSLFYDVEWDVSYDDEAMYYDDETLNGLTGTSDIVQKLKSRLPLVTDDSIQTAHFSSQLNRITEAALVIRNMCLQHENAQYLAKQPMVRDYLAIVLNLPQHPGVAELQHYALDTAEQILVWSDLGPQDAVYQALLRVLSGQDRGAIITALKTISRIAMHSPLPKRLNDVPKDVLQRVQRWLLVEDEELRSACLDFLFQFTSFGDNVAQLLHSIDAEALARQLSRLLLFAAKETTTQRSHTRSSAKDDDKVPAPVPRLSKSLVESLLKLDEPERSSEWLRMCFAPNKESEITQISLWQAYQATFAPHATTHPHLIAGEFIKNVSATFAGATAQVAGANKYVIRGIRPRKVPVDTGMLAGSKGTDKGKELHKCSWRVTVPAEPTRDPITGVMSGPTTREVECGEWFKGSEDMLKHILREHLQLPAKKQQTGTPQSNGTDRMDLDSNPLSRPNSAMANGHHTSTPSTPAPGSITIAETFDFHAADKMTYRCRWAGCRRMSPEFATSATQRITRTALFARHIQTHLPETDSTHASHNVKPSDERKAVGGEKLTFHTLEDERGDAAGISLSAALVLRNLAKFMPQTPSLATTIVDGGVAAPRLNGAVNGEKKAERSAGKEEPSLMEKVFDDEVREKLFHAMTHGRPIHNYVGSVVRAIGRNGG